MRGRTLARVLYFTQMDTRFHVCAVEPERNNFSVLKTNCTGLPITPIEAAVASEAGKLWLNDPGIGSGDIVWEGPPENSKSRP